MSNKLNKQIFQDINDSLNHMEDTGKVDMSILNNLEKLEQILRTIKTKWLEYPNTDAFYFYQAIRNVELILGKMKERFKNSKIKNDNPKIARDSLILMPVIVDVLQMAQTSTISDASINNILKKTKYLRDVAASSDLIEPLEIDRESIDKESLRYHFRQLMTDLGIKSDDEYMIVDD